MTKLKNLTTFHVLNRSMLGVLSMVILVDMGERMAERFLPIYLMALGGGFVTIGVLSSLDNLLSALYAYPGAWLSDRIGIKRALLVFNMIAIFGFAIAAIFPTWQAVLFGALFFISFSAISLPATMGLISKVFPKNKRAMGVTMHSLVRRIPMALGPLAGGAFITFWGERDGVRYAFIAAIAMALLSIALQQLLITPDTPKPLGESAPSNALIPLFRTMSPELRSLLVSDILIRFCEQIPGFFVVVWCMKTIQHSISAFSFSILTSIEMATAILVYIPVAWLADKSGKKPFVTATFCFFTAFPVILLYSNTLPMLVFAFIVRGLKEFGEPTRKALIMDLAPENNKTAMFGLYYLIRDVIVSLAGIGGAYIWEHVSPQANLIAAAAFGALGTLWFAARGKDMPAVKNA